MSLSKCQKFFSALAIFAIAMVGLAAQGFCGDDFVQATESCKRCLKQCVLEEGKKYHDCIYVWNFDMKTHMPIKDHGQCWNECGKIKQAKVGFELYSQCRKDCNKNRKKCENSGKKKLKCKKKWMLCQGDCLKFQDAY